MKELIWDKVLQKIKIRLNILVEIQNLDYNIMCVCVCWLPTVVYYLNNTQVNI